MKRLVFFIGFIGILFLFYGCNQPKNWTITNSLDNYTVTDKRDIFPVYYESNRQTLEGFEPLSGCMVGADISGDSIIEANMEQFNALTKKNHEIFARSMEVGDQFPLTWALECFTQDKIPMITLYPKDRTHPFDLTEILRTAESMGEFQVPVFLQFYPSPSDLGTPEEYTEFFIQARKIFSLKAPNAIFVWSIPLDDMEHAMAYYPGDVFVDWIGVDIQEKSGEQGENIPVQFLQWYYTFQKKKPLMISRLRISHFSTKNSEYTEQEAITEILRLYGSLKEYPAVKAVIYGDENPTVGSPLSTVREDYLLTESDAILQAYQTALTDPWFLPDSGINWEKSPFVGYVLDKRLYIQQKTLDYDLQINAGAPSCIINGSICYFLGEIPEYRSKLWEGSLWLEKKEELWKK